MNKLQLMIDQSNYIVFFGGAGVSTESGIKDFRSKDGLYNEKNDIPPEFILSHGYFEKHTQEFFDYYRAKMLNPDVLPNAAHKKLVELEKAGKLKAVITQNIDSLHQKAGSKNVYELHGSVERNYCTKCGKMYDSDFIMHSDGIPTCSCGGVIKPDVVLYEEGLDPLTISGALDAIRRADLLIVAGTSLTVYPAAAFLDEYPGNRLVLINKTATPRDDIANLALHEKLGEVFQNL